MEGINYNNPVYPPAQTAYNDKDDDDGVAMETLKRDHVDAFGNQGDGTRPVKRARGPPLPKNAISILNETYGGNLSYQIEPGCGPVHAPTFDATLTVNGQVYTANAPSKKLAKLKVAQVALAQQVQHLDASAVHHLTDTQPADQDFTSDTIFTPTRFVGSAGFPDVNTPEFTPPKKIQNEKQSGKNPLMILNELKPGLKYTELGEEVSPGPGKLFVVSVEINGQMFQGCGRSKKIAKTRAAQAALTEVYGFNFDVNDGSAPVPAPSDTSPSHVLQLGANRVSEMVLAKYAELTAGLSEQFAARKVLAGVVMTAGAPAGGEQPEAHVVCVATGSKCISGDRMSACGAALNDSHAEVLARRCLRNFLYAQVQALLGDELRAGGESAPQDGALIVERCYDDGCAPFRLRPDVQFHLYISSAPCGDARLFAPHERGPAGSDAAVTDSHPNRKARGLLRVKIESGEGSIPVKACDPLQTWDGVVHGERLNTMSCSDKILQWGVLGIQGSLLSQFLEPVYLSSLVLGSLYHSDHLQRAVSSRLRLLAPPLPPGYTPHRPHLTGIACPESRRTGKAPNHALTWTAPDVTAQPHHAMTGRALGENPLALKLTKSYFFRSYQHVMELLGRAGDVPAVYGDAKRLAVRYQAAKSAFRESVRREGLGRWVKRPFENDQFSLGPDDEQEELDGQATAEVKTEIISPSGTPEK